MFVSAIDNLGAVVDIDILQVHIDMKLPAFRNIFNLSCFASIWLQQDQTYAWKSWKKAIPVSTKWQALW
jgi:hypothetical protein